MTRKKKWKRDKDKKIEKILEVSKQMIIEKGYKATTTNQIANKAKISIGLVYNYFPKGKAEILHRILQNEYIEIVKEDELSHLTLESLPVFLRDLITDFIKRHRENVALYSALDLAVMSGYELFDTEEFIRKEYKVIPLLIEKFGNESDSISNEVKEKWSLLFFHLLDSLVHRHIMQYPILNNDDEFAEYLTEIALRIFYYNR